MKQGMLAQAAPDSGAKLCRVQWVQMHHPNFAKTMFVSKILPYMHPL
jgi:hypothetical protein